MFHGEKGDESPSSSTETVEQALARFVAAFDDLDWERFRNCFSENATIFHPTAPNIKRIDSPEQFDKAWLGVFDRIKKNSGRTSPPYMKLDPTDVRVEKLSDNVTLVTFHLVDGGTIRRCCQQRSIYVMRTTCRVRRVRRRCHASAVCSGNSCGPDLDRVGL
jgi:ketosteroid isomerase-like protein